MLNFRKSFNERKALRLSAKSSQDLLRWKPGWGYAFIFFAGNYYRKFCLDFIKREGQYYLTMGKKTIVLTKEQADVLKEFAVEREPMIGR